MLRPVIDRYPTQKCSARLHLFSAVECTAPHPHRLGADTARSLLSEARAGRVVPNLRRAVQAGHLEFPDPVRWRLLAMERAVQATSMRVEQSAQEVVARLHDLDIDPIFLKGLATGRLDHASPQMRQTSDVDVLIAPDEFAGVIGHLMDAGYQFRAQSGVGVVAKSVTLKDSRGVEIDVHRLPTHPPYGQWVLQAERFETSEVMVSDVRWRALSRPDRFVNAVAHYVLSQGPLRRLSSADDAVLLWPSAGEARAWVEAVERWQATTLVAVFAQLMAQDFGLQLPPVPGCSLADARWYERELVTSGTRGTVSPQLLLLTMLPRGQAMRRIARMIYPTTEHMAQSQHSSRVGRLAHGGRMVVGAARRALPARKAITRGRRRVASAD